MQMPIRLLCPLLLLSSLAGAQDIVRYKLPNGNPFPISAAVEVPPGKTLVFLSGTVPPVADPKAPKDSVAAYGDTKTQTIGALNAIKDELDRCGQRGRGTARRKLDEPTAQTIECPRR